MMRSSILATFLLLALSGPATAVSFINPPPPSGLGTTADFRANPVYKAGSVAQVAWTDTQDNGIRFSVVVLQVDYSKGAIDIPGGQAFEYVVHDAVNLTSSGWVVTTAKDLTFSNVFVLTIFFQGDTTGRALSHWFNMTKGADETTQSNPTSTTTSSTIGTSNSVTTLAVALTDAPSSTAPSTSTPPATNDGGFGTGAKVGLAVGVVAVLALGIAVGWFWSRRNRSGRRQQSELAMGGSFAEYPGYGTEVSVSEKALPDAIFHEADSRQLPRELDSRVPRYELSGK